MGSLLPESQLQVRVLGVERGGGFGFWGCGVLGLWGFGVLGLGVEGFRVLGFWVLGLGVEGFRVLGFRVLGLGFWIGG